MRRMMCRAVPLSDQQLVPTWTGNLDVQKSSCQDRQSWSVKTDVEWISANLIRSKDWGREHPSQLSDQVLE